MSAAARSARMLILMCCHRQIRYSSRRLVKYACMFIHNSDILLFFLPFFSHACCLYILLPIKSSAAHVAFRYP